MLDNVPYVTLPAKQAIFPSVTVFGAYEVNLILGAVALVRGMGLRSRDRGASSSVNAVDLA